MTEKVGTIEATTLVVVVLARRQLPVALLPWGMLSDLMWPDSMTGIN